MTSAPGQQPQSTITLTYPAAPGAQGAPNAVLTHRLYIEGLYRFANVPSFDPISNNDRRYKRCEASRTCPLATEFYSANEHWVKAGSLMTTDPGGRFDCRTMR